jgi:hypothetical protein
MDPGLGEELVDEPSEKILEDKAGSDDERMI